MISAVILFTIKILPIRALFYVPKRFESCEKKVTMLPGAGIGPELMEHVQDVFKTLNAPVTFEEVQFDPKGDVDEQIGKIAACIEKNGAAIKGNLESCFQDELVSRNEELRQKLDVFAYIFHCISYPSVEARHKDVDVVIIRHNVGGEYSLLEHEAVPGVTESLKVMSRRRCERLATFAFQYAQKNKRKKITTIHKANIMKLTNGLFLETAKAVAKKYSDIEHKHMIVDNCCMQIVSNPSQFDVMLTTNLQGSIVSNILAGLAGGPGIWSGINHGPKCVVFEPALRTSGNCLVGMNCANPVAMLNAGVDLLCHLGFTEESEKLAKAIFDTMCDEVFTPDLCGNATTCDVVNTIKQKICCSS